MKVIEQYVEVYTPLNEREILQKLEAAGRVCYKSEDKIKDGSAETFIANIIKRGHEAVLEHASITIKCTTDRAVTHEIVRHRLFSYCQESQRYCNYSKDKFGSEVVYIRPVYLEKGTFAHRTWNSAMSRAEMAYFDLLDAGLAPEEARAVLPNSCKTEIVMTANIREWRHFLKLRTSEAAHPQMRDLAGQILDIFKANMPVLFGDI